MDVRAENLSRRFRCEKANHTHTKERSSDVDSHETVFSGAVACTERWNSKHHYSRGLFIPGDWVFAGRGVAGRPSTGLSGLLSPGMGSRIGSSGRLGSMFAMSPAGCSSGGAGMTALPRCYGCSVVLKATKKTPPRIFLPLIGRIGAEGSQEASRTSSTHSGVPNQRRPERA